MKKLQRIFAILGIVFLLFLYILTFVTAILSRSHASSLFQFSLYCTIIVPIIIYGYTVVCKVANRKHEDNDDTSEHKN